MSILHDEQSVNISRGEFPRLLPSEPTMDETVKLPVLPMGLYRIEDATAQYGRTVKFKCSECKQEHKDGKPILEVSRQHMCVAIVCPSCGANNPLIYGTVQRISCVPQPDPVTT